MRMSFWDRRSALVGVLVLLVGSWLAAFSFTLWRLRAEALENGQATAVMHARNFEGHLTQTLQVVDVSVDSLVAERDEPPGGKELSARLLGLLRPAPYLRSLSLVGADGRVLASSSAANLGVRVDPTGFFPAAASETSLLRIGQPWRGRDLNDGEAVSAGLPLADDEQSFIPVIRRLESPGRPLWAVAAINPDYFINHFSQQVAPVTGRVQWLRYDDLLLVSSASGDAPGARQQAGGVSSQLAQREFGTLVQRLPDGFEALTAYRVSSRYPALIAVHLDRQHILAQWRQEARRLAMIVIPILLALTLAVILVWRRQNHVERQRAELEKQRRLAASVFEASTDAVIITSASGDILSVNAAFESMNGYTAGEVLGRNPRFLASGNHDNVFYRGMWEAIVARGHWQGEIVNRRKDGRPYTGLLTINAVRDGEGNLQHYVGVTADISERKRHEAELLAAKERAETAVMAKTTFLATMSHELRTPMNGVLGMTELLLHSELNEKQYRQLDTIKRSANNLLTILNDILDYATIEGHSIRLETLPLQPAEIVRSILRLFAPHAASKSIALEERLAADLPQRVLGDPVRLRQILTNLVSNAVKFTHAGEIVVAVRAQPSAIAGEFDLYFSVTDTGIGIPPEKQVMVFDAFSQADGSMTRAYGGTGLGLAISRRLAEAMGGELTVDSQPGEGSCFTLRVPVQPATD